MNLQALSFSVLVPKVHWEMLNKLSEIAGPVVKRMLCNRLQTSSKYYKELPCVVAKSLSSKYQKNPKCKRVRHLVIPVCGDKGKQIKSVIGGIRIPALFKKEVFPVFWMRPIVGHVRSVEFCFRDGKWIATFCANVECKSQTEISSTIGIDRNSVGNVAVLADPQNGHVRHLGFNPARTKTCWRGRKRNLQLQRKRRLLFKIGKKSSRRSTHQNHIVSKQVVDYAQKHSRAIVLEKLMGSRSVNSKIRSYSERNQWAFAQLASYIQYKARLAGVPVVEVDPAYTSQTCSRCGHIHKPEGKVFLCPACGHKDHRDANAAFVIAKRGMECIGGLASHSVRTCCGPIDGPLSGTGKAIMPIPKQNLAACGRSINLDLPHYES